MKFLIKILPDNDIKRKWYSIIFTIIISLLLALLGIYGFGEYGISLFLIIPFFIGISPVILYGLKKEIKLKTALGIAFITLGLFALTMLIFALEGIICIAMASPLAAIATLLGALTGWALLNYKKDNSVSILILLILSIPLTSFVENKKSIKTISVTTSIEINASLSKVWKNVISFPELEEPNEFLFKAGISYPINAEIKGNGVGAVRYCNFTTGSFVEPIVIWDEPNLLQFTVDNCPAPMTELSFWDIDAPHLHDFFVSKKGQFKLTKLSNGKTLLEGTTWYTHKIKPEFYWQLWSNYIVHKIHDRVLVHIKKNSEAKTN